MKNKKWKQFEKLTDQCYMDMIGSDKDGICWEKAFELLMEIVREERQKEPNCFQEVYMLDEATDYQYDISEWIEDCLDEIDMREQYDVLLATVYKGNIIKNLIMDCQSYTKYRPNETTGGIFVSWRRKEELPTGA